MAAIKKLFFKIFGVPNVNLSAAYGEDRRIEKELPEKAETLKLWTYKVKLLRFFQIFLGVVATFFSLLTATLISYTVDSNFNGVAKVTAFIAALAVALMAGFDLGAKANNVVRAWRKLHVAVISFNQEIIDKAAVIKVYEDAEDIVGDVSFQGGSSR